MVTVEKKESLIWNFPFMCPTISCESLLHRICRASMSLIRSRPSMNASYLAWLFDVLESNGGIALSSSLSALLIWLLSYLLFYLRNH